MDNHVQDVDSTSPFFSKLPPEVRDQIYEYAYGTESETSKIVWRKEWKEREMEKRKDLKMRASHGLSVPGSRDGTSYQMKRFPGSQFARMIVSKQFYLEAAQAWLRTANLTFEDTERLEAFIANCHATLLPAIRSIELTCSGRRWRRRRFVPNLHRCVGLRRLKLLVMDGLDLFEDKADFVDDLEPSDFQQLVMVKDLSRMDSIKSLEVVPHNHDHAETPREMAQYRMNLTKLESFLMATFQERRDLIAKVKAADENIPNDSGSETDSMRTIRPIPHAISLQRSSSTICTVLPVTNTPPVSSRAWLTDLNSLRNQPMDLESGLFTQDRAHATQVTPDRHSGNLASRKLLIVGLASITLLNTLVSILALYYATS